MSRRPAWLIALSAALLLAACSNGSGARPIVISKQSPFLLTASIQDLMRTQIDPSADLLWDSVSTEVTARGEIHRQPATEGEWNQLRNSAITLTEAANLLVMDERRVVAVGKEVEDAHILGIRKAAEIERAITTDRNAWIGFAHALHAAGEQTLKAIDARAADQLLQAGETVDAVCEACHLTYWYPGQVIPKL